MSRIGKLPIKVPSGVEVTLGNIIAVKGKLGSLSLDTALFKNLVKIELKELELEAAMHLCLLVSPASDQSLAKVMWGTARALLNNLVVGVTTGFEKKLQLVGVGYRAQVSGKVLNLQLGYSHPVDMPIPEGLKVETPTPNDIIVSGSNKEQVGLFVSKVMRTRKRDPYKGKGFRYFGAVVTLKETKKK